MKTPGSPTETASENPVRAASNWPPAVIAGAYRTGIVNLRTLVRRGVRATYFDCEPSFPGFRSVYGRARLCPNPDSDPAGWLEFMVGLATEMGDKPALIASADQFVSAIAVHADELAKHYRLSPGVKLAGALADKRTQYDLAAKHGMPLPRTQLVKSLEDITAFAGEAEYPCLLKPLHFREWQRFAPDHSLYYAKIAIAKTRSELIEKWRLAAAINPVVIAQEIIQGPDDAKRVYLSCYDRDGKRIANAMFRELRCNPLGFGPATVTEPIVDVEVDDICNTFLQGIGYSGLCEMEVKRDARDGRVKLIEANPRLTGGGDAAPYAGVDLCWINYLDLIGQTVTPVRPNRKDFRHIDLRADVGAIIAYRRAGLISWGDVFRSYKAPRAFFDFDAQDWRYSLETVYRVARSAVGNVVRQLTSRRGRSSASP